MASLLQVTRDGRAQKQMRTFGSTTRELVCLREWLRSEGCTHVAMESTGVYWKPVYAILEGAFEIVVENAQQVNASFLFPGSTKRDTFYRRGSACRAGSRPTVIPGLQAIARKACITG